MTLTYGGLIFSSNKEIHATIICGFQTYSSGNQQVGFATILKTLDTKNCNLLDQIFKKIQTRYWNKGK